MTHHTPDKVRGPLSPIGCVDCQIVINDWRDLAAITTAPPPIPASYEPSRWDPRQHMLVWAHTGRAHVRLANGERHRIDEGTGLWLPAGDDHELWTEPGSLAIPAWVSPQVGSGAPDLPLPFSVADGWRDWLIHHYVLSLGPMTSNGYTPDSLLDILAPSSSTTPGPLMSSDTSAYPPIPRSIAARTVAQSLLRNPAFDHTVEEWAKIVASSPRTLRREFVRETELTFAEWRTSCRLAVACELLAAGFNVEHTAVHAGFGSRNGLTRAFRAQFDVTPRDYAHLNGTTNRAVPARVANIRQVDTLMNLMADAPDRQPELPHTFTAPRVNNFHVLAWTYRGEVWARIAQKTYTRKRGDAIWLPAGVENETGWPPGSLGVPVGDLQPHEAQIKRPFRAQFSPSWDRYLLYCSVSAYTGLRPENYDHRHILDIFEAQFAAERARTLPMPKDFRARAVAEDFLRRIEAPASADDIARETQEIFHQEIGMTFIQWRTVARMRIARDLLATGAKPSAVARRIGYSQLSNFSRDFRRFHQVSPREFQEQQRSI